MRTLLLRGLVEEAGTEGETGATLFRTTGYFLERLGLARLSDLPDLTQFLPDDFDEELDRAYDTGT
jgi:segregation and condensation protein B